MTKRIMMIALSFLLMSSAVASAETLVLSADANQQVKPMSPLLYGLFFEDINYAADGGLYAELLQNRSFEYRSFPDPKAFDAFTGWVFNDRMAAKGSAELLDEGPLHENNPHFMRLTVRSGAYRAINAGYPRRPGQAGIPLKEGLAYHGSIWLRSQGYKGPVSVQLFSRAGEALSEPASLNPGEGWAKHTFALQAAKSEPAVLAFTFPGTGILDLDMATLFPADAYGADWPNGGLRADLVDALRRLQPRFIRFPGGCVAEGSYTPDNIYRWKDTIGPIEQRKENENTWGYMQSYGLGFHEYFQLCEDLGAEPLPVVSAAMVCQVRGSRDLPLMGQGLEDYIQDVLDLIEYANGPAGSPWGKKRSENGHTEPFGLKFLAIGNENWGSEYFYRYGLISSAVKAAYPDITCIIAAGPLAEGDLFQDSWTAIRRQYPSELVDEHYYMPSDWFLSNTRRYDSYPRGGNTVFLGEYAAHEPVQGGRRPNNLYSALAEAAYLTGIERNADLVTLACYAPLLAREGKQQWTPNLIWFDLDSVVKTPNYHVQQMFSSTLGTHVLDSTLAGEGLFHVVTRNEKEIQIKLVNPGEETIAMNLSVLGLTDTQGSVTCLSGQPGQTNSFQNPDTLVPVQSAIKLTDGTAAITILPWSATVITLPAGQD